MMFDDPLRSDKPVSVRAMGFLRTCREAAMFYVPKRSRKAISGKRSFGCYASSPAGHRVIRIRLNKATTPTIAFAL